MEGGIPPAIRKPTAYLERAMSTLATIHGLYAHKEVLTTLDTGADVNVISPTLALELELKEAGIPEPRMRWGGGTTAFCHGTYVAIWEATDSLGVTERTEVYFYALDRPGTSCILGMPGMKEAGIELETRSSRWRYAREYPSIRLISAMELEDTRDETGYIYELRSSDIFPAAYTEEFEEETEEVVLPEEYQQYKETFDDEIAASAPPADGASHAIETTQEPPFGPLYNLSVKELEVLRRYLEDAVKNGWIRPSTSPAGAPILFVPKKDGTLRLCVDYRGLNKVTIKNRHPLPLISEILDRLQGAGYYTKLDLKNAYHRIRIQLGHEWKTAFRTRYGHFEYLVMPFGLANAPATFQAYINKTLSGLVDTTCIVYLDDILIYSKDRASHVRDVSVVLERLQQFGLYANLKKCKFFTQEVDFLGFIVGTDGVKMDPRRVESITQWPLPRNYTDVQVFLGFCNFYRRFIAKYSKIAAPLTSLFKGSKNGRQEAPFQWNDGADTAFRQLRDAFAQAPILAHFDPSLRIRVETDASIVAIAAILSQLQIDSKWHPIAFWSRRVRGAEEKYKTYEQELLAIVAAFVHWRHYLDGSYHPIEVLTDHNNLKGFANVKQLNGRQARWAMLLSAYDFVIVHRAGKTNPADAPSRRPDYAGVEKSVDELLPTLHRKLAIAPREVVIEALSVWQSKGVSIWDAPYTILQRENEGEPGQILALTRAGHRHQDQDRAPETVNPGVPRILATEMLQKEGPYSGLQEIPELIKKLQGADALAVRIRETLKEGPTNNWEKTRKGLLKYQGQVYVPDDHAVRTEILRRYHDDPHAGHFGTERTTELVKRKYYWPGMNADVAEHVRTCDICQKTKVKRHAPYGELQSLPQPKGPWQQITIDFMSGIPPSKWNGKVYDALLVIVDRYTKMALYIPVTKKLTAAELADLLLDRVVTRFGTPLGIVSDRDSRFTSAFWSDLCYFAKIKRQLSTAFHPQTDGQTERQNQTVQEYLRAFCSENQASWAQLLAVAEFAYNNSKHSSIGISPFMAMYGYNPEIRFDVEDDVEEERVPAAKERIESLHQLRGTLADRWEKAVESQAKQYNKKHVPMKFNKGDLVLVSTKNLSLKTASRKLSARAMGPFRVLEPVGSLAYRIQLPAECKIHPVFSVSLLEKYHRRAGDGEQLEILPPPEIVDGEEEWEVEEILSSKNKGKAKKYLVKWVGYPADFNQWVPAADLRNAPEMVKDYQEKAGRRPNTGEALQEDLEGSKGSQGY
jgi:transposase InsO family protein